MIIVRRTDRVPLRLMQETAHTSFWRWTVRNWKWRRVDVDVVEYEVEIEARTAGYLHVLSLWTVFWLLIFVFMRSWRVK